MSSTTLEMLSKDNYDTWCLQAEALLIKNDTWGYVSGELPKPPNPTGTESEKAEMQKALNTWINGDRKAKADLVLFINPSELKLIRGCKTSQEIWKKLELVYASSGPAQKINLLKQLLFQKMSEGDDVLNYLNNFYDAVDKLEAMDVKIQKDVLSIMLLYNLPNTYENFRSVIETQGVLPEVEKLKLKILEEAEAQRQQFILKNHSLQKDQDAKNDNISNEQIKKNYEKFQDLYKKKEFNENSFIKVKELQEKLFNVPWTFALAHCVAEDMNMDSGIAEEFSIKFERRDELYQQRQKEGGLAVLEDYGRFIYYLVTKKLSNGKTTSYTMWNSLQKMQQHIEKHRVKNLAIPQVGFELDCLEWSEVKAMIEYTFRDTNVKIIVCNFQQPEEEEEEEEKRYLPPENALKCLVRHVRYPLADIQSDTAIIYFGTVNGHISEEIQRLNSKFEIVEEYTRAYRRLGDVIQVHKIRQKYSLFGCITRTTEEDLFDFTSFQKCIDQITIRNIIHYHYVGIQGFHDDRDDLLLNKIINMLRYSFIKVDLFVCWEGKMLNFMPQ